MNRDLSKLVTLSNEEVLNQMDSSLQGLLSHDVQKRQVLYGLNEFVRKPYRLLIFETISHSINPLVAILLIAALVSAFTGNIISSSIIITMVITSIGLDYFQSHRSLIAIKKIQKHIAIQTNVLRDRQWREIPCQKLVPGDIIQLIAADVVPADALLLKAKDLFQTGWFVESLATQTLVVFVIRSIKNPWQKKPSIPLISTVLLCVSIGVLLPFTPIAKFLGFVPLPATYFLFLFTATVTYLFLVNIIKRKLMWRWI